jgi:hypothetical protein
MDEFGSQFDVQSIMRDCSNPGSTWLKLARTKIQDRGITDKTAQDEILALAISAFLKDRKATYVSLNGEYGFLSANLGGYIHDAVDAWNAKPRAAAGEEQALKDTRSFEPKTTFATNLAAFFNEVSSVSRVVKVTYTKHVVKSNEGAITFAAPEHASEYKGRMEVLNQQALAAHMTEPFDHMAVSDTKPETVTFKIKDRVVDMAIQRLSAQIGKY